MGFAELPGFWIFIQKFCIEALVNHTRDFYVPADRNPRDAVISFADFSTECTRREPNAEAVYAHPKELSCKEMPKLVHEHENTNGNEEIEDCWQEAHSNLENENRGATV